MTNKDKIDVMIDALKHCKKVFQSMSERGAYPRELLPFNLTKCTEDEPLFLGVQGYMFVQDAINVGEEMKKEMKKEIGDKYRGMSPCGHFNCEGDHV
jgi:hypothetical protein